jgi:hypothetical protein
VIRWGRGLVRSYCVLWGLWCLYIAIYSVGAIDDYRILSGGHGPVPKEDVLEERMLFTLNRGVIAPALVLALCTGLVFIGRPVFRWVVRGFRSDE